MFLQEFFQTIAQEIETLYQEHFSLDGPTARLRKKLRIMYGRGEIDRETFFRLKSRLDLGYYIEGELQSLHRQAVQRRKGEGLVELGRSLEQVYMNLARLEEARAAIRAALGTIASEQAWADRQIEEFWEQAQAALPDEGEARAYLEVRQQLMGHREGLEQRAKAVRQDLRRIDQLEAGLRMSESRLVVAQSRGQLVQEEISIRKRLHS